MIGGGVKGKMVQGEDEMWSWCPAGRRVGLFAMVGGDPVEPSSVNGASLESWLALIVNLIQTRVI